MNMLRLHRLMTVDGRRKREEGKRKEGKEYMNG